MKSATNGFNIPMGLITTKMAIVMLGLLHFLLLCFDFLLALLVFIFTFSIFLAALSFLRLVVHLILYFYLMTLDSSFMREGKLTATVVALSASYTISNSVTVNMSFRFILK